MAIIVEEEKNNSNLTSWLGVVIVILIAAAAFYYLFISQPDPAVITPPAGFEDITPIAQLNFDPTSVLQDTTFQSLKQPVAEPTSTGPQAVGKTDPFAP